MAQLSFAPAATRAISLFVGCATVGAQCTNPWGPGSPCPGAFGTVRALVKWDPDGAGPAAPLLVVGGAIRVVGSHAAGHIAAYDTATGSWHLFAGGFDKPVHSLAVLPNGELVAGGEFETAAGVAVGRVARWTGVAWAPLGAGLGGPSGSQTVVALAALPNGDLIAGGGLPVLARWNGSTWSSFGNPQSGGVTALRTLTNGDLVVGGMFDVVGGVAVNGVAKWSGGTWSALGSGLGGSPAPTAFALSECSNGDLLVAGQFTTAGGVAANYVARWDGSTWSPLGTGVTGNAYAVAEMANGHVVVSGHLSVGGTFVGPAIWDGATWSVLGQGVTHGMSTTAITYALLVDGNGVWVGGAFTEPGDVGANGIARWDAAGWTAIGTGFNATVGAFASLPDGSFVAGGAFRSVPGGSAAHVARFDGSVWHPLGAGVNDRVDALLTLPDGDLLAGGAFTLAGGVPANHVARWNGTAWAPLGAGLNGPVRALARLRNGDVVAAGVFTAAGGITAFGVARWDGSFWHPLGIGMNNDVTDLAVLPNGVLVAAGVFTHADNLPARGIAQWDGIRWSDVGGSMNSFVTALAVLPNGDLLAGGNFTFAGGVFCHGVARWDGSAWSPLGGAPLGLPSTVASIVALPDGSAIFAGALEFFAGGKNITRWRNNTWSPFGAGVDFYVSALARAADDTVLVGGVFAKADGQASPYFARLGTTCPAAVVPYGGACAAPGGPTPLAATDLPWLGATFRATATGLPANTLVLAVSGLAPAVTPLFPALPQGVPGCALFVTPDFTQAIVPVGGTAISQLALPLSTSLVGASFAHQHVPLTFGPTGNLLAAWTSNALAVTLGQF